MGGRGVNDDITISKKHNNVQRIIFDNGGRGRRPCGGGISGLLTSCQQLDDQVEPAEETYTKAFVKEFGLIDPDQDWNMATRGSVTVTTASATEVKVYAKTDDTYRIVGDYDDVSGTQTLEFDVSKGTTDILVEANGKTVFTTLGGSADFSGTRTASRSIITNDGSDNPLGVTVKKVAEYKNYDESDKDANTGIYEYAKKLPEGEMNLGKVTCNFHYTTGDEPYSFTIWPAYTNTSQPSTVGVYYEKDGTRYYVPFYQLNYNSGNNDDLQYQDESSNWNNTYLSYFTNNPTAKYFRALGIKITIPKNTSFGFYIYNNYKTYMHSQQKLNTLNTVDVNGDSTGTGESVLPATNYGNVSFGSFEGQNPIHVATFKNDAGMRCLCFEDWPYLNSSIGDFDLNDLVFYTDLDTSGNSTDITEINEDAASWILAAEDLGGTDDFDFNDMVVSVSHVSGKTTATLKALAAGGTLPVKLCYNGSPITGPNGSEEWHSWFSDGSKPSTEMINTSSFDASLCNSTTITVPTDFSMAQCSVDNDDKTKLTNMGGFSFVVARDGDETFTTEIKAPMNGEAPQMMCLPGTWKWPTERTRISTAYTKFGEWGANYTNTDWLDSDFRKDDRVLGPQ